MWPVANATSRSAVNVRSSRRRSVTFRAMSAAPLTPPRPSASGPMLTEMSIGGPSRHRYSTSAVSIRSPVRTRARTRTMASPCAADPSRDIGRPIISSAGYPNSRPAAGFQSVTAPSNDSPTIASAEAVTSAPSRARARSTGGPELGSASEILAMAIRHDRRVAARSARLQGRPGRYALDTARRAPQAAVRTSDTARDHEPSRDARLRLADPRS